MITILFNIAFGVPGLITAFHLGMQYPHGGQQPNDSRTADMPSDWNCRIEYVMQWDTDKKKLFFDGQPIYRGHRVLYHPPGRPTTDPSDDPENEYSFEAPSWESLCAANNAAAADKRDGRTHYQMKWDETKKTLVFDERRFSVRATAGSAHQRYMLQREPNNSDDARFEAPTWESLCSGGDEVGFDRRDGQVHYQMEWDNAKKRYLFNGRTIEDKKKALMASMDFRCLDFQR